ncbi:DEAD/DEAH box helicase [Arthrobacter sp. FW306-07-I]|uniref:DEAD/DEAH box helicase n=1 Tax=Arthrobacter sp. FW306-07-I TaxID=2879622 RepID=UPI001F013D78|nr:DEAD/DEAH box helicase [Arthrobacter sp. FW306-07-I]UKA76471.1 DEAD/DEAH box helicase [Arthrobacter sp. FW306-07-I]
MSAQPGLNEAVEYHIVNSLGWSTLRPLQRAAVLPIRSGSDCLLLAPTAGGKTEAAVFPILSELVEGGWYGLSVLYVTPLRALLNNLQPRINSYASWVGRRAELWHGDVGPSERKRILSDPPEILLTTPESLESMLVSRRVDHDAFFANVRAIVVDEVHAFAGDDRGWHLLSVLERVQRIAGRPIQRIGLSATVGNPQQILDWLQGSALLNGKPSVVVSEEAAQATDVEVVLDYVGSIDNAAQVLSKLHRGEKRLAFCVSRSDCEELAYALRQRGVTAFVSHASLSADERRLSEQAFAESRDCVIVATSTLELGIDVGDLDRVIQIDSTWSVSSFLQRLGRTGRRPGSRRNALFLTTNYETLLRAAAVLLLWKRGFVEAVEPPTAPNHICAQQILALALQEGQFSPESLPHWWGDLSVMDNVGEILDFLRDEEFLAEDSGLLFIGPRAEKKFGRRYFMDLLSAFTAAPELTVIAGQREIGSVAPISLVGSGPTGAARKLLLSGRSWLVEAVDWDRHVVRASEMAEKGSSRWQSGSVAESYAIMRAMREILLGATPDVQISKRAQEHLPQLRASQSETVEQSGLVLHRSEAGQVFWTWAGLKANLTLLAAMGMDDARADNAMIRLPAQVTIADIRAAAHRVEVALPFVPLQMIQDLKFSAALPTALATRTLAARLADLPGAKRICEALVVVR